MWWPHYPRGRTEVPGGARTPPPALLDDLREARSIRARQNHHWTPGHGHRVRHRRPPLPLAVQAHPLREEGPQPVPGPHQPQGGGRDRRGRRPAQAPAVDGPRPGPLLHHVGLHHPAAHDHRGLRRPLRQVLPHPGHRDLGLGRLHRGLLHRGRADRPHHLRHHPPEERAEPPRAQVTLLRLPSRCRLARPPHDRRRHDHAPPLPRGPGQHRPHPVPLRLGRLRLPHRGQVAGSRSVPAPTRSW